MRRQTLSRDEFGNDGYEPGDTLGKNIDQLIEFNIESVDCKFTENLSGYWQQVKGGAKSEERKVKEDVRPIEHWEKAPMVPVGLLSCVAILSSRIKNDLCRKSYSKISFDMA